MYAGFYEARFDTPNGSDKGVLTLTEDNKVFGGNSEFKYVGTYTRDGNNFIANVEVKPLFVQISGGLSQYVRKIKMMGSGGSQNIMCVCESSDLPGVEISAVLQRVHV